MEGSQFMKYNHAWVIDIRSTLAEKTDIQRDQELGEITISQAFSLDHKYVLPKSYSSSELL